MTNHKAQKSPRIWPSLVVGIGSFFPIALVAIAAKYFAAWRSLAPDVNLSAEVVEQWAQENASTPSGFFSIIIPIHLTMAIIALIAAAFSRTNLRQRLGFVKGIAPLWHYPILMAGCLGVQAIVSWAILNHMEMSPEFQNQLIAFAQTGGVIAIAVVLYPGIVAAPVEELLFRGFVLNGLLRRWRPIYALAISILLFAFLHPGLYYNIAALFTGAWIAVVFWRTRSIWPAIACHASNTVVFILLTRFSDDPSVPFYFRYTPFTIGVGIFGLVMLGISIWLLFWKRDV